MGKYCRQHIGKTFNDGNLIVVDGGTHIDYVKVKCNVCSEDSELFGEGIFETPLTNLLGGSLPCGCSSRTRWSLEQYEVRIKRKITEEKLPIQFLEFGLIAKPLKNTPIKLYCTNSGKTYEVSTINSFLQGVGNFGRNYVASVSTEQYELENPNYRIWDSGKKKGTNRLFGFYCSICESKGYESVFEINSGSLFRGSIPCYCSKSKTLSADHVLEMSKIRLHEEVVDNVQALSAYKKGVRWFVAFICKIHGIYSREYQSLGRDGCHCTKCTPPKTGYDKTKQGYIYILDIRTQSETSLGYGITNKLANRLATHRRNLKSIGATITNIQVFEGSGTSVLAVENAIKSLHTTGLIDCEGFRRESISIDRKDEVLELCKKLKELDNHDKLI